MADLATPYLLVRPTTPIKSGIVAIAAAGSIDPQFVRICERLAAEGYGVAAPELFFRTGGPGGKPMGEQAGEVQMDELLGDLAAAAKVLRANGAERIGVTGFCLGGSFTWYAACYGEGYDAAVSFYGALIPSYMAADPGREPSCPTLVFYGGSDQWIPREDADTVAAHHPDTVIYPDAGHAFMSDGTALYVPEAAEEAWQLLLAHFGEHLSK
jgi:carboxymethylenebutenolidase